MGVYTEQGQCSSQQLRGLSPAPRSWKEDIQTSRSHVGNWHFSTVGPSTQSSNASGTVGRTWLAPLGDERHPLRSYADYENPQCEQPRDTRSLRFERHGWGDTTLLMEDGYSGKQHPRGMSLSYRSGKGVAPLPASHDERRGLFGVLQGTEAGAADSWVGNPQITPAEGKGRPRQPPPERLFEVLHYRNPGLAADDSWLGHAQIDPKKGKGQAPGPEQTRGRRDLMATMTQSILREPNRHALLCKGADPLGDAWCGNEKITPQEGKATLHVTGEVMHGGTYRSPVPPGFSDFRRPHTKPVAPPVADTARQVLDGTASVDHAQSLPGKRVLSAPVGLRVPPRSDLYAHMTFRPLSHVEEKAYSQQHHDKGVSSRRHIDEKPGVEHGKGPDMLAWKPEENIGQFVPFGKLAQSGRRVRTDLPGGTMQKPMAIPRTLSKGSARRF